MIIWLNGCENFTLSHHVAKFGGFKHCESGDKIFLIPHVISRSMWLKGNETLGVAAPPA